MIGRVIARGLLAVAVVLAAAVDAGRDHSLPPARRRASSKARPSPAAPRIERDYRTMRPRLVVGHSLGAIFVSYSVGAAPSFFDARFAHSPAIWRDEDAIAADLARSLSSARGLGSFFYLSVGEKEGGGLGDGYAKLHTVLRTHAAAAGLRWRAEVTPGAVHETNVARATPSALRAYFAGLASPKR
jgi:predicted alpha/beta superfamily hydrolase